MEPFTQSSKRLSKTTIPCCKLRYRPRSFSSKGAKLVLLWNLFGTISTYNLVSVELQYIRNVVLTTKVAVIVVASITWFLSTILSGWLADVRLGRYRTIQTSILLIWLGAILNTIRSLLNYSTTYCHISLPLAVQLTLLFVEIVIVVTGIAAFYVNGLQFGVDQMPDASSEQITSFIAWNVTLQGIGVACAYAINGVVLCYLKNLSPVLSIISVTLLSIILCSDFLLKHRLNNFKQAVNPFATVLQVLKYAMKHKYPVNRSAFTYCEDNIPPRIDNGKTKYGGPYTTEQVENVKTFLQILVMVSAFLSFPIITMLLSYGIHVLLQTQSESCNAIVHLHYVFALIGVIVYELVLYPLFKNWVPNMMKRIGLCMFVNILISILVLVQLVIRLYSPNDLSQTELRWMRRIATNLYMFCLYIFITSVFEFIYAQSPENSKGFLSACIISVSVFIITFLSNVVWYERCETRVCRVAFLSFVTVLSILALCLYILAARWYKKRERDESYNERATIEDIYSRQIQQNYIDSSGE